MGLSKHLMHDWDKLSVLFNRSASLDGSDHKISVKNRVKGSVIICIYIDDVLPRDDHVTIVELIKYLRNVFKYMV